MSENLFPSGPWVGFYNYAPKDKHRMELTLTFTGGRLQGDGLDDVGRFVVEGRYDAGTLECWWTKTYLGAHHVFYRGFREGKGIWGTWEISVADRGGFHIWPRTAGEGETQTTAAETSEPAEAVGREIFAGKD